jgi:hypothetical protein
MTLHVHNYQIEKIYCKFWVCIHNFQLSDCFGRRRLCKGVATGAIATVAGMLLWDSKSISIAGIKVPGSVAMGLGAAAGSLSADLTHKYLVPHIPANQKYEKAEFAAISIAASGLGTYFVSNMIGTDIGPAIALGAGSYISGDYIYHNFINKKEGGFLY